MTILNLSPEHGQTDPKPKGRWYFEGCWGPIARKYLDLMVYQVLTIVKFGFLQNKWEEPIELDTPKIKIKY